MDLHTLTIAQAADGLAKKLYSSRELTDACLARIDSADKTVQAFLSVFADCARAQADAADARLANTERASVLDGIPLAIKDNILVKGTITTAASKILEQYTATYDAAVMTRLNAAGAVTLGKTNMDEFAMGSSTESSAYQKTKNPWDLSRVPGGSSGGSTAAVAADECIASLGSDTGGSIRQPASFCGVVGLKPTYGMVSRSGLIAMASSLDQIGPITKTVEDAAILFDAIKGSDPKDASSAASRPELTTPTLTESISGMRIGLPKEYFAQGLDPIIEERVRDAARVLESLGAELVEVEMPYTEYALSVYYIIMPAEVSANLARFDGIRYGHSASDAATLADVYRLSREEGFGPEVRRRIILGTYVLAAGYTDAYYKQAQKVREMIRRDYDAVFRKVDCLLTPTSPVLPFKLGEKIDDPLTMYLADIYTVSANIAGVPGLSLPCGFADESGVKLPIGMQLLGKHFDESTILRVGHQFERATEWHTARPTLH